MNDKLSESQSGSNQQKNELESFFLRTVFQSHIEKFKDCEAFLTKNNIPMNEWRNNSKLKSVGFDSDFMELFGVYYMYRSAIERIISQKLLTSPEGESSLADLVDETYALVNAITEAPKLPYISPEILSVLNKYDIEVDLSGLRPIQLMKEEPYRPSKYFPMATQTLHFPSGEELEWDIIKGIDSVFTLHELDDGRFVLIFAVKAGRPNECIVETPGGRIDKGESAQKAALREVREETGLSLNAIQEVRELGATGKEPDRQATRFTYFYTRGGTVADFDAQKLEAEETMVKAIVPPEAVFELLMAGNSLAGQGIIPFLLQHEDLRKKIFPEEK